MHDTCLTKITGRCPIDQQLLHLPTLHDFSPISYQPAFAEVSRLDRLKASGFNSTSCRNIAWIFRHDHQCWSWLQRALHIDPDNPNALLDVAECYELGRVVSCDLVKAEQLRRRAAPFLQKAHLENSAFLEHAGLMPADEGGTPEPQLFQPSPQLQPAEPPTADALHDDITPLQTDAIDLASDGSSTASPPEQLSTDPPYVVESHPLQHAHSVDINPTDQPAAGAQHSDAAPLPLDDTHRASDEFRGGARTKKLGQYAVEASPSDEEDAEHQDPTSLMSAQSDPVFDEPLAVAPLGTNTAKSEDVFRVFPNEHEQSTNRDIYFSATAPPSQPPLPNNEDDDPYLANTISAPPHSPPFEAQIADQPPPGAEQPYQAAPVEPRIAELQPDEKHARISDPQPLPTPSQTDMGHASGNTLSTTGLVSTPASTVSLQVSPDQQPIVYGDDSHDVSDAEAHAEGVSQHASTSAPLPTPSEGQSATQRRDEIEIENASKNAHSETEIYLLPTIADTGGAVSPSPVQKQGPVPVRYEDQAVTPGEAAEDKGIPVRGLGRAPQQEGSTTVPGNRDASTLDHTKESLESPLKGAESSNAARNTADGSTDIRAPPAWTGSTDHDVSAGPVASPDQSRDLDDPDFLCVACADPVIDGDQFHVLERCEHFVHAHCVSRLSDRCLHDNQLLDVSRLRREAPNTFQSYHSSSNRLERLKYVGYTTHVCRNIGWIYRNERDGDNVVLCYAWFEKALKFDSANPNAMLDLAECHEQGLGGRRPDLEKATQLRDRAAPFLVGTSLEVDVETVDEVTEGVQDGEVAEVVQDGEVAEVVQDGEVAEVVQDGKVAEVVQDGEVAAVVQDDEATGALEDRRVVEEPYHVNSTPDYEEYADLIVVETGESASGGQLPSEVDRNDEDLDSRSAETRDSKNATENSEARDLDSAPPANIYADESSLKQAIAPISTPASMHEDSQYVLRSSHVTEEGNVSEDGRFKSDGTHSAASATASRPPLPLQTDAVSHSFRTPTNSEMSGVHSVSECSQQRIVGDAQSASSDNLDSSFSALSAPEPLMPKRLQSAYTETTESSTSSHNVYSGSVSYQDISARFHEALYDAVFDQRDLRAPSTSGLGLRVLSKALKMVPAVRKRIFSESGFVNFRKRAAEAHDGDVRPCRLPIHYNLPPQAVTPQLAELDALFHVLGMNLDTVAEKPPADRPTIRDYYDSYKRGVVTPLHVMKVLCSWVSNPTIKFNGLIYVDYKRALEEAALSTKRWANGEPLSVFDGVPFTVKDSLDAKECFSGLSSYCLTGKVSKKDCDAVDTLRKSGMIMFAKCSEDEFCVGVRGFSRATRQTLNPHNRKYISGGSSGGSAATVAAGLCPVSLASTSGGGIRIPAACCGVYGLKASFSRISTFGRALTKRNAATDTVSPFYHVGPITGCAEDLSLMYYMLAGFAPHRPISSEPEFYEPRETIPKCLNVSVAGLRIGIFEPWARDVPKNVLHATNFFLNRMVKAGAVKVPVAISHLEDIRVASHIDVLSQLEQDLNQARGNGILKKESLMGYDAKCKLAIAELLTEEDRKRADVVRAKAMKYMQDILFDGAQLDVIVTPAIGADIPEAPKNRKTGSIDVKTDGKLMRFTSYATVTGIPACVVPVLKDYTSGLPYGVQVMAAPWNEKRLLEICLWAERELNSRSKMNPPQALNTLNRSLVMEPGPSAKEQPEFLRQILEAVNTAMGPEGVVTEEGDSSVETQGGPSALCDEL